MPETLPFVRCFCGNSLPASQQKNPFFPFPLRPEDSLASPLPSRSFPGGACSRPPSPSGRQGRHAGPSQALPHRDTVTRRPPLPLLWGQDRGRRGCTAPRCPHRGPLHREEKALSLLLLEAWFLSARAPSSGVRAMAAPPWGTPLVLQPRPQSQGRRAAAAGFNEVLILQMAAAVGLLVSACGAQIRPLVVREMSRFCTLCLERSPRSEVCKLYRVPFVPRFTKCQLAEWPLAMNYNQWDKMDYNLCFTEWRFCTDICLRRFSRSHKIAESWLILSPRCFSSLVPVFSLLPPCLRAQEQGRQSPAQGPPEAPRFHGSPGVSTPWAPGPAPWAPGGALQGGESDPLSWSKQERKELSDHCSCC